MLTLDDLLANPKRLLELGDAHVLVAAKGTEEVVVQKGQASSGETIVFMHETIAMMRAERAERMDKLEAQLDRRAPVLPIRKKPESFWDEITVGRATSSDLVVDDPATSNLHAHMLLGDDDNPVSVQDVGSSNGTFVNRERIQPHQTVHLRTGDCLRFGQSIYYYLHNETLREIVGAT